MSRTLPPLRSLTAHPLRPSNTLRPFTTTPQPHKKPPLPPRPTLPDTDLKHVYLKGSGPGGQKINKTSSAVQLTHLPTGLVVKSQATRSRTQNHNIARRILAEKIEVMEKGAESRVAKVVERARKRKASAGKKARRKYRKLDGVGDTGGVGEEGVGEGEMVEGEAEGDGDGREGGGEVVTNRERKGWEV